MQGKVDFAGLTNDLLALEVRKLNKICALLTSTSAPNITDSSYQRKG